MAASEGTDARGEAAKPADGSSSPPLADVTAALDRLRVLIRAVGVYPAGHARVEKSLAAFRASASALGTDLDIAVRSDALLVCGRVVDLDGETAKTIHAALGATGVGWVVAEAGAPDDAWLTFASRLHANLRRVQGGRAVPEDLWAERIPGIEVELLRFERSAFAEGVRSAETGGGGGAGGGGGVGMGAIPTTAGERDDGSADLLALLLRDRMVRVLLRRIRSKVLAVPEASVPDAEDDLLARLLRFLPYEVRNDPLRGLRVVRESLERFLEEAGDASDDAQGHRLVARLANAASDVFASPAAIETRTTPLSPAEPRAPDASVSREALETLCREASAAPTPTLSADGREVDGTSILIHAVLALEEIERRDAWRERLVERLRGRDTVAVACLQTHLAEAAAGTGAAAAERRTLLLGTALEAGLDDLVVASGPAALELVLETFPRLFGAFVRVPGGHGEAVARRLGFDRVFAAGPALLGPGGALEGENAEAVLAERSVGILPFVALLLGSPDEATRERGARTLKAIPLPPTMEALVRAVPLSYLPPIFRKQICRDVFEGADPARMSRPAVAAISAFLQDPAQRDQTAARTYATAALRSFDRADAEPVLRLLLRRRLLVFPVEPRPIRRTAETVLKGLAEEAQGGTSPEAHR